MSAPLRRRRFAPISLISLASLVALVGAAHDPVGAVTASRGAPHAFYVDCGAPAGGDGSIAHPWNSLADANAVPLTPGRQLLLRRGSACSGILQPQGSGSAAKPVVIGDYGTGALPRVVGTGTDAVLLDNVSHVVLQNLEVTNPGATPARRRGVHVVANGVVVSDVTVRDLSIHDVAGDLAKDYGGSGGIQVDAAGPVPSGRFDGLRILDNRIEHVTRSGIFVQGTQDSQRPRATHAWPGASTGVEVQGNQLAHLGGDGIVATGTVGAVLEGNVVVDGNQAGTPFTQPGAVCDAGIWTFNANSTLIQYNEVSDMEFNGCDGTGYDVDYDQDGTVVQYNYSHDNAGGFILLCNDPQPRVAEVRYNLSVDDAATFDDAPCDISSGQVGTLNGIRFYNNTFVAPQPQVTLELSPLDSLIQPGTFEFRNNIVVATEQQSNAIPCGRHCSNNLFFGLPTSGTAAVARDPRFVHPGRRGSGRLHVGEAFRLRTGSPALGAGVFVPGGPPVDYFGNPVPNGAPPAIGFAQPAAP